MYHMAGTDTSAGDTWDDQSTDIKERIGVIVVSSQRDSSEAVTAMAAAFDRSVKDIDVAIVKLREVFAQSSEIAREAGRELRRVARDFDLFSLKLPKNYKFWHFNAEYKPFIFPELKQVKINRPVFNIRNRLMHTKPFR